jgi:hypothetical protein
MRGVWLIAASVAWVGCRLDLPEARIDASADGQPTADAPPDAPAIPACMLDPTYSSFGGHRFKVLPQAVDYDSAIDGCAADGAHLAVIDSAAENDFARTLHPSFEVWIGLDDLNVEASFRWITGAPSSGFFFTANEPNDNQGEDCTQQQSAGTWNDTGCETALRPLCECDPTYQPPPTPACRKAASGFETRNGRRYFVRSTPRTWQEAETDCKAIGAHLLVIGDVTENNDLDVRLPGTNWLGYTDANAEGEFKWVNGSPSSFNRWPVGVVPINEDDDCAILQDLGAWTDANCANTYPYACECDPAPP